MAGPRRPRVVRLTVSRGPRARRVPPCAFLDVEDDPVWVVAAPADPSGTVEAARSGTPRAYSVLGARPGVLAVVMRIEMLREVVMLRAARRDPCPLVRGVESRSIGRGPRESVIDQEAVAGDGASSSSGRRITASSNDASAHNDRSTESSVGHARFCSPRRSCTTMLTLAGPAAPRSLAAATASELIANAVGVPTMPVSATGRPAIHAGGPSPATDGRAAN